MTVAEQKQAARSETGYLTVDGVRLETRKIAGDPAKPTLVFLHEGLGCIGMWRDFPERVAERTGLPVLAYSRQGYGASDSCDVPRPLTYMHIEGQQVLPALLRAAGIDQHILLGHSDGGSISLINAGSAAAPGLKAVITMAAHVFCEQLTVDSIADAKIAYEQTNLREKLARYHGDNVNCAFWGWNRAWLDPDFIHWNIEEFLPAVTVPQLVIQGCDDQYGTEAQVKAIARQSGGPVAVRMLENCGHSPYKEQTEASLDAIAWFVATL